MQLLLFSAILSASCAVGAIGILLGFSDVTVSVIGISAENLFLAPIYMLELCFYVLSYGWMVRKKRYVDAARGLVLFPLCYLAFCVILRPVEIPMHKLALSILLARGVEVMYYGYYLYGDLKSYVHKFSLQNVWRQGKKYIDFPKYMLIGSFIDMAAVHAAPFLVTAFWGLETTGYYSMAMQVLAAPLGLIEKAVGDVFRQEGARLYGEHRECIACYRKNLRLCLVYSAVVCVAAYIIVPMLLPMLLGAKWNIVGQYVQWMLPMTFMVLVASPVSTMYIIARRQREYLVIQSLGLLAVIIGLGGTGYQGFEVGPALVFWGGLSIVVRIINIYGGWRIAKGETV